MKLLFSLHSAFCRLDDFDGYYSDKLVLFDVKMAIASFWVLPVAIIIVASTAKIQQKLTQKSMDAKIDAANGIQECIDTIADLKSNNAEKDILYRLTTRLTMWRKEFLKTNSSQLFLCPVHKWYSSWVLQQQRLQARRFLLKANSIFLHFCIFAFGITTLRPDASRSPKPCRNNQHQDECGQNE